MPTPAQFEPEIWYAVTWPFEYETDGRRFHRLFDNEADTRSCLPMHGDSRIVIPVVVVPLADVKRLAKDYRDSLIEAQTMNGELADHMRDIIAPFLTLLETHDG